MTADWTRLVFIEKYPDLSTKRKINDYYRKKSIEIYETSKEMMSENFLKLLKDIKPQIEEAVYTSNRINAKKNPSRHILVK